MMMKGAGGGGGRLIAASETLAIEVMLLFFNFWLQFSNRKGMFYGNPIENPGPAKLSYDKQLMSQAC